jgi:hypothetical protein
MKKTLICVHVMPLEIEMFERFMQQYKRALLYLDENDNITIKASLNLNPELTDWENSKLSPKYFIDRFLKLFDGINNINEIIIDNSLMGTTQQKRESIKLNYDQFIFVDADIVFPEQLLKYQLEASYILEDKYIIIPNLTKLWDNTWDILVHDEFQNKPYNYYQTHNPLDTINQNINNVELLSIPTIKFGCGMHTLYSKSFWDFIGIPESFGGYGPEDTFGMFASLLAIQKGHKISEYLLKGIYITEDYTNRTPEFKNKIKIFDKKQEFRNKAESIFNLELQKFNNTL